MINKQPFNEEELYMYAYEQRIMDAYVQDLKDCNTRDQVNKVYRQVRVWNRWHHFKAEGCTEDRYIELNQFFKEKRWAKLDYLSCGNEEV